MIEGLSPATNKEQLDSLLGSWNLQRVLGDGNCFFTSVATSLLNGVYGSKLKLIIESMMQWRRGCTVHAH